MLFNKFNETNEAKENTDNKEVSTGKWKNDAIRFWKEQMILNLR